MKRCNSYGSLRNEQEAMDDIEESYENFDMTFGSPFRQRSIMAGSSAVDVPPELLLHS